MRDAHDELAGILGARKLRTLMGELQGESLTRVPKGFDSSDPAADLIKRKRFILYRELDPALAQSPKIVKEIVTRLETMAPFVEFLQSASDRTEEPEEARGSVSALKRSVNVG